MLQPVYVRKMVVGDEGKVGGCELQARWIAGPVGRSLSAHIDGCACDDRPGTARQQDQLASGDASFCVSPHLRAHRGPQSVEERVRVAAGKVEDARPVDSLLHLIDLDGHIVLMVAPEEVRGQLHWSWTFLTPPVDPKAGGRCTTTLA